MGDMKLLFKQFHERDIELCNLIDRLLTSFGYSPENKLQPDDFESFVQKAKQERGAICSSIEEIIDDYIRQLPNTPKPNIAYKILETSADLFCWPRDLVLYLPLRIMRTNRNIIDAYAVATVVSVSSVLAAAYVDLKLNTFPKIMFGYALYTVLTYIRCLHI